MKASTFSPIQTDVVAPKADKAERIGVAGSDSEFLQTLQTSTAAPKLQGQDVGRPLGTLKFSNHAIERMRTRGITFDPQQLRKLEDAVEKAEKKGAKDTLVITDNAALVVSVKNKTVVTALDKGFMKDNVFTNIDSTVLI